MRVLADEHGVIVSWFARLAVWLALVSVFVYDAGAIVVNYFGLDSTAATIAVELSNDVASERLPARSPLLAQRARELAREDGAKLTAAWIDEQGDVNIRLARPAKTILLGRIGALHRWTRAVVEDSAETD